MSVQLAADVGAEVFGSLSAVYQHAGWGHQDRAFVRGETLELLFTWGGYGIPPGRVRIAGVVPHLPRVHSEPWPAITCAVDRGAEAIARDVSRRLLPRYTELYVAAVRAIERRQSAEGAVARLRAKLEEAGASLWGHQGPGGETGFTLRCGRGLEIEGRLGVGNGAPYIHDVSLRGLEANDLLWARERLRREEES